MSSPSPSSINSPAPPVALPQGESEVAGDDLGRKAFIKRNSRRVSQGTFWAGWFGFMLLAAVLLLMPVPIHSQRMKEFCDLVHLPLFAVLTWSTLAWSAYCIGWRGDYWTWKVATFWFVVGSGLEFGQKFFQRGASWGDAIANALGIMIGVLIFLSQFRYAGVPRMIRFALALLILCIGWGWSWYQLWQTYR